MSQQGEDIKGNKHDLSMYIQTIVEHYYYIVLLLFFFFCFKLKVVGMFVLR